MSYICEYVRKPFQKIQKLKLLVERSRKKIAGEKISGVAEGEVAKGEATELTGLEGVEK